MNKPARTVSLSLAILLTIAVWQNSYFALPGKAEPNVIQTPKTAAYHRSIVKGTRWLVSAMRIDGTLGTDLGHPPDLGCTAIAGLALLAQGNTPYAGPYHRELRRIQDAVLNIIESLPENGEDKRRQTLIQRKIGDQADLFLSALFLSQLLGEAQHGDKEVKACLEKLVKIICNSQQSDGTWGNKSWAPILGTVLGWECLRASASAGLKVDASAGLAGKALLQRLKQRTQESGDWMHDFYKHASSIRVLYSLNYREEPVYQDCLKKILKTIQTDHRVITHAGGEEYLGFFFVTECLLQDPAEECKNWYPTLAEKLASAQNTDGSWTGHHCIRDRTFCTAAALLALQAPNLAMPISSL